MKLALLSNVTVDLLAASLKKQADLYLSAGFDTWQQEMIIPESGLYLFKPDALVLLIHADAYTWASVSEGYRIIDEWIAAIKVFSNNSSGIPLFVSSVDISNIKCCFGAEKRINELLENYLIEEIQGLHGSGCRVYILPVKELISDVGRESFYSTKMWYFGSMPYSMKGITALTDLIVCYASSIKGRKKKCIAVDLDNTLWGGVIGEDGADGIILSNHNEGARYYDTQRILKSMKEQGVMIAVVSKNNAEDVEPVFKHPYMLLQHEDFVAEEINWQSKTDNIKKLAKKLNIGLDAFVFLDDNPVEREQMKVECPEVEVIDFPKDSSLLPDVLENAYYNYFFSLELTGEDLGKTEMYRSESKRIEEKETAASVEDYLNRLEMEMDFHLMLPEEEKRVTQLINKTNQFNVTTIRYSEDEVKDLSSGDSCSVFTVHLTDKYGDQGLIAVLILKYEKDTAVIDTFLMSCRVMGRSVENEILSRVKDYLQNLGLNRVKASYIKTAKNAPVSDLFDKMGFTCVYGSIKEIGDKKNYEANVSSLPDSTGFFK